MNLMNLTTLCGFGRKGDWDMYLLPKDGRQNREFQPGLAFLSWFCSDGLLVQNILTLQNVLFLITKFDFLKQPWADAGGKYS